MADNDAKLDHKRLYKNSAALYLRTFYTLAVGLYTSRVVLDVLGLDDFGIYSLIGTIVVTFGFFSGSVSSAMSRFLSYDLALGDPRRLASTFGSSVFVAIAIGIVILVLGEVAGWIFLDKLDIPAASRGAAAVVYQLSLFTSVVAVLQTCYTSAIIARERMKVFAVIEMMSTTLKLLAVFALMLIDSEKLILYAVLVLVITVCTNLVTIAYCRSRFPECKSRPVWERGTLKAMFAFSGWNLFKTFADTVRPSGISVVVNLFFGVVVNASVGIALNVSSNLAKFTANVFLAFKPQIIKQYAGGAIDEMGRLMANTFKFSYLALGLMIVPFVLEMPYVLVLWLKECPEYASTFCRLLCIAMFFEVAIAIIEFGINATGRIWLFCLLNGTLTISTVVLGWVAFRFGAPPPAVYLIQILTGCTAAIVDLTILHRQVPDLSIRGIAGSALTAVVMVGVTAVPCTAIHFAMPEGIWRLLAVGGTDVIVLGALTLFFVLTASTRARLFARFRRQ